MDIMVIFVEKISRTFGYDCRSSSSPNSRNENMKTFLNELPLSYWAFIDSDARTCMRMFAVILTCHADDLSKVKKLDNEAQVQLKMLPKDCDERNTMLGNYVPQSVLQLCGNFVFRWVMQKLGKEYLKIAPFIEMLLNECNCLDALRPAKLALQKVLWITQTLMFV